MLAKLRKSIIKKEDTAWSLAVRELAGNICEKCGSTNRVQAHHVFTRANKSVRHYLPNGVALCSGHHRFFAHMKPIEFIEWLKEKRGQEWYDDLVIKKNCRKIRFTGSK